MKLNKKFIFTTAGICIAAGLLITLGATVMGGRAGVTISRAGISSPYEKHPDQVLQRTKLEDFKSVDIVADYANLNIIPSDGYYLEYQLMGEVQKPRYTVNGDTFTFRGDQRNTVSFFNWSLFSFYERDDTSEYYINLYVPKELLLSNIRIVNDYGDVTWDNVLGTKGEFIIGSGDLTIGNANIDHLSVNNEYGEVNLDTFKGKSLTAKIDSGDLKIGQADFDKADIVNEYGTVDIKSVKGNTLTAVLDSSEITLGKADLKDCSIKNEYGSVSLTPAPASDQYDYDLKSEYGSIQLGSSFKSQGAVIGEDDYNKYITENQKNKKIKVYCDSGNIIIN